MTSDPRANYEGLRDLALHTSSAQLGLNELSPLSSYGVLMETGYPNGVATLVCFLPGDTSLYFSNGGGVIGAGEYESVRATAKKFVAMATEFVSQMTKLSSYPTPGLGRTKFYVLTESGTYSASALEQELGKGQSALSPLFHAGHEVIGALRPFMT